MAKSYVVENLFKRVDEEKEPRDITLSEPADSLPEKTEEVKENYVVEDLFPKAPKGVLGKLGSIWEEGVLKGGARALEGTGAQAGASLVRFSEMMKVVREKVVHPIWSKTIGENFVEQDKKLADQFIKWGETAYDWWNEQAKSGWEAPDEELFSEDFLQNPSWERAIAAAMSVIPSYGIMALTSGAGAGPLLGASIMGALESSGGTYMESRKAGNSILKSQLLGGVDFVSTTALEVAPFDSLLKAKPGKALALAFAKISISEGGTEGLQETIQNLIAKVGYDNTRRWYDNVVEAMVGGAIGGGTLSVFHQAQINQTFKEMRRAGLTEGEINKVFALAESNIKDKGEQINKIITERGENIANALKQTAAEASQNKEEIDTFLNPELSNTPTVTYKPTLDLGNNIYELETKPILSKEDFSTRMEQLSEIGKTKAQAEGDYNADLAYNQSDKTNGNIAEFFDNEPIIPGREFNNYVLTNLDPKLWWNKLVDFSNNMGLNKMVERTDIQGYEGAHYPGYRNIDIVNRYNLPTLAHEIGHLIHTTIFDRNDDFTKMTLGIDKIHPDKTKLNNILVKEMEAVGQYVSPWDERTVSKEHFAYRKKPTEVYANYMSLYLLNPNKAMEIAPTMTTGLNNYMESNPKLQKALAEFYKPTAIGMEKRLDDIKKFMFGVEKLSGVVDKRTGLKGKTKELLEQANLASGIPFFISKAYPKFKPVYQAFQDNAIYLTSRIRMAGYRIAALDQYKSLPKASQMNIANAIYRGSDLGWKRKFSIGELKAYFSMNAAEIKAYNRIRKAIEYAQDIYVEKEKIKNDFYNKDPKEQSALLRQIEEFKQLNPGYFPIYRKGNIGVYASSKHITFGNSKVPYFQLFTNNKDALETANTLKKMNYDVVQIYNKKDLTNVFREHYKSFNISDVEQILEIAEVEGPTKDNILNAYRKQSAKGINLNFLKKKNVPGFERTPENMMDSTITFITNASSALGNAKAMISIDNALDTLRLGQDKDLYRYAVKYRDSIFQNYSQPHLDNIRKGIYLHYLMFKTSFLMQNLTQPLLTSFPETTKYLGYKKGAKVFFQSYNLIQNKKFKELPQDLQEIMKLAEDDGLNTGQETEYLLGIKSNKTQTALHAMGVFGQISEKINRTHDVVAGYLIAKEYGLTDNKEIYDFIKHYVHKTQFAFGKHNIPLVIQGAGTLRGLAKNFYLFKAFYQNYLNLYYQTLRNIDPEFHALTKNALAQGKELSGSPLKGATAMILSGLALSGVNSIPLLAFLLYFIKKWTGFDFEEKTRKTAKNTKFADLILSGIPGFAGIDSRYLLGLGMPIMPDSDIGEVMLGAGGNLVQDYIQGINYFRKGEADRGMEKITPHFVRNMLRAAREKREGAIKFGDKIMLNDPENSTLLLRSIGLQPMNLSRVYSSLENFKFEKELQRTRQYDVNREYFKATQEKNYKKIRDIKDMIIEWNKSKPRHLQLTVPSAASLRYRQREAESIGLPGKRNVPKQFRQRLSELRDIYDTE